MGKTCFRNGRFFAPSFLPSFLLTLSLLIVPLSAFCQTESWIQQAKLTAGDGDSDDMFGYCVAVEGDTAVVSAIGDENGGPGSVYVFVRQGNTWIQQTKLPDDNSTGFGQSIDISGNTIVIGTECGYPNNGAVYVFVRDGNNWIQQARLVASDGAVDDRFGVSVDLEGNTLVMGAMYDDDQGNISGSAYIFERNNGIWIEKKKLLPTLPNSDGDQFGTHVAISGNSIIVCAPGANGDTGAAYIYVRNGDDWFQQAILTPNDVLPGDEFGVYVSIFANTAVVSNERENTISKAYVFNRLGDTWTQIAALIPTDGSIIGDYGLQVLISGNTILLGNPSSPSNNNLGAIYIFKLINNNWTQVDRLIPNDQSSNDFFGISIAMSEDAILVGARFDDDLGTNSGSAYIFTHPNQPPVAEAGGPYSGEEGSDITLDGSNSSDPDGTIVSYEWDLDNDGDYDATGVTAIYHAVDNGSFTVGLKVTDNGGLSDTDTETVTVNNVAPIVNAGPDQTANEGDLVTVNATFTDPGILDTHTATIDWGDGTPIETGIVDENSKTATGYHVYADNRSYVVTITVTDNGEGSTTQPTIIIPIPNLPSGAKPLEMELIPNGTFTMGCPYNEEDRHGYEWPPHQVTITKDFYLGKYEVTQAQWWEIMRSNPSACVGINNPVNNISYDDCVSFMNNLKSLGLGTFRLPTEAEWEYACRAGTSTRFYWGNDSKYIQGLNYMWYDHNNNTGCANEVGLKLPNAWGLYDMSGNLWEWCQDYWKNPWDRGSQIDPFVPNDGSNWYIIKGGVFRETARWCRSGNRSGRNGPAGEWVIGFRVLKEILTLPLSRGTDTTVFTVNNAAPTVEAGLNQTVNEGALLSLNATTFNDKGTLDTHTATIDWGDGSVEPGTVTEAPFGPSGSTAGMNGTVWGNHIYTDNGSYTVTVTVRDDDGLVGTDTFTVNVNNLPPIINAGLDQTANEGDLVTINATFTDPGILDTHTAVIDWGDGIIETVPITPILNQNKLVVNRANKPWIMNLDGSNAQLLADVNIVYYPRISNGLVAFMMNDYMGQGKGIYVMKAVPGSPLRKLPGTEVVITPNNDSGGIDLSPDGIRIVYSGSDPGDYYPNHDIYIQNVDGSGQTKILRNNSYHYTHINWGEPNRILFIRSNVGNAYTQYPHKIAPDGSGYYQFNSNFTQLPFYGGPFEKIVASQEHSGNEHLVLFDSEFNNPVNIPNANRFSSSCWHPTENSILAVQMDLRDIFKIDVVTGQQIRFTNLGDVSSVDCGSGELAGGSITASHVYADNGSYPVSVTVTDQNDPSSHGSDQLLITVNNVAPTVNAGANQTVEEGNLLHLNATFNDKGTLDTHTATIDWGDGSIEPGTVIESPFGPPGSITGMDGTVTGSHIYQDNGTYPVTVTVTDDDNVNGSGVGIDTLTVTVNNVQPTVTAQLDKINVDEGSVVNINGSIDDPGVNDTFTVNIDWGEPPTADDSFSQTGRTFLGSHLYKDDTGDGNQTNFQVTIIATDANDNTSIGTWSNQVTVNNVPPTVGPITAPVDPVNISNSINVSANFTDPGVLDTHTAVWDWDDGTTSAGTVNEVNGSGSVSGSHMFANAGVYTIKLTVTDKDGSAGQSIFEYVVIYDPSGGFVTGGGWINSPPGAYAPDPTLTGKANFGFVSKYKKGASVPTGNTEFQFKAGNLNFHSESYEWLVIAGYKAKYKGVGTINNAGNFGFMLTAVDGQAQGGDGIDKFRIKIWDKNNGDFVIYDNKHGVDDDSYEATAIGGGSIVIHKQ